MIRYLRGLLLQALVYFFFAAVLFVLIGHYALGLEPPDPKADIPPAIWANKTGSRYWFSSAGYSADQGQLSGWKLYVLRVGVRVPVGTERFMDLKALSRAAVEHYWTVKPDPLARRASPGAAAPRVLAPPKYVLPGYYLDENKPPTVPF